jgi:ketosteroid isomerase-like protein
MHPNEALLHRFYQAFQQKDYQTMQACYAPDATFNDPAFKNLNGIEAGKMWEMLLKRGKDLELVYDQVEANDQEGKAHWVAKYTFSSTGNHVTNRIDAHFVFENGLIKEHRDEFDFYTWSKQALGLPGRLLGWTSFLQKKVQSQAMAGLRSFIAKG